MKRKLFILTSLLALSIGSFLPTTLNHEEYHIAKADDISEDYGSIVDNPGATYATQRVWLNDDSNSGDVNAISFIKDEKPEVIIMPYITDESRSKYFYADIPYQDNTVNFLRIQKIDETNYTVKEVKNIEYLTFGSCYIVGDSFSNIYVGIIYSANASILSLVLESFLTYGKAPSNGSTTSTMQNVYRTWINHKAANEDEMKSTTILDYTSYNKETGSYEGYTKGGRFSLNEKWNTMCSIANIDPKTGELRRANFFEWFTTRTGKIILIGIAGVVLLVGVMIIFLIIKKKRQQ